VEAAAVAEWLRKMVFLACTYGILGMLFLKADELPENEFQAVFNGYFDNFRVNILYPMVSLTKRVSGSTSITGRYLVDCITAASMRSRFEIDGMTSATSRPVTDAVTSASQRNSRYPESTFDEVRHEWNAGLSHLTGDGSLSLNLLYSTEHDYRSWTLATQFSYPFAMKNTAVQLGFVRSWDEIFPDTRSWTRNKAVFTASAGLTQILSQTWIVQANLSATRLSGYLSDPYQPVPIFRGNNFIYHETVLPGVRLRKAAGLRSNWMWNENSSIQVGYRYYLDDWAVRSHTAELFFQQYLAEKAIRLSLDMRRYIQQKADFFKTEYTDDQGFLTVDSKLNNLWSNEVEISADIKGTLFDPFDFLYGDRVDYRVALGFYQRHTPTPDWFSGYKTLYAYTLTVGLRYRF
jgi:hypothetical protein